MFDFDFDGFLRRELEAYHANAFVSDAEQARLDAEEREADAPRFTFAQVLCIVEAVLEGEADVDEGEAEAYADSLSYEDGLTSANQIKLTLSACFGLDNRDIDELFAECL